MGRSWNKSAKTYTSTSATTNDGNEMKIDEKRTQRRSTRPSGLFAVYTPIGIATASDTRIVRITSSAVAGSASVIASITGRLVTNDSPKLPVPMSLTHLQYRDGTDNFGESF